jgi:hypothetical protein
MSEAVQAGQVWAGRTHAVRTLRIDETADGKALCTVLANSADVQAYLNQIDRDLHPGKTSPPGTWYGDKRGTTTRISIARFTSYSTLVRDVSG